MLVGVGLREPPELLLLFEAILDLVHEAAPGARIAFNSSPADTLDAVRRVLGIEMAGGGAGGGDRTRMTEAEGF